MLIAFSQGCSPRILGKFDCSVFLIIFEGLFGTTLVNLGLIGDFNNVLEAKLSVEMELSLEEESDLLLVRPGLNTSLVGVSFLICGDNGAFVVLVLSVGDNGIFALADGDNGIFTIDNNEVFVFTIGDNGVFVVGDDGGALLVTATDDCVFVTGDFGAEFLEIVDDDCVFVTGDFGAKFLEIVDGRTLVFKVVVFDTTEVDFIVEEDLTGATNKVLDSFLTITFGEIGPALELTMDLVTVDFIGNIFIVLGFVVNNFEGEVGAFTEIDFGLEVIDELLDIIDDDLFVGVIGNLTTGTLLTVNTVAFLTGVVGGFTTVVLSFDDSDFKDVGLSSLTIALVPTDLTVEVEGLTDTCNDLGTVEVIDEVLDTADNERDLVTGEETTVDLEDKVDTCGGLFTGEEKLDFDVEIDFSASKDVVEDLVLVVT